MKYPILGCFTIQLSKMLHCKFS